MRFIRHRRLQAFLQCTVVLISVVTVDASLAFAQQTTISGRITTATAQPLSDARVVIVGTTLLTATNVDGRYTFRGVPNGSAEVRVSHLGYIEQKKTVTVAAGSATTVDFTLVASAVNLNELVVTATGPQRKVEIGNSISVISAADRVRDTPIHNMADLLVAKAPGLSVLPGNMSGAGAQIRIRGLNSVSRSNAPIYIIDGVRMDGGSGGFGVGGSNSSRLDG